MARAEDDSAANESRGFYAQCRKKIEHEDNLVNHRMMWLLTLNGLLFTAFGFSLAAEASSLGSKAFEKDAPPEALKAKDDFLSNLRSVRNGLVLLGCCSSATVLIGVLAAYRAIRDDELDLCAFPDETQTGSKIYPKVIGGRTSNVMGMLSGVSIPFLTAGAWMWVGNLQGHVLGGGLVCMLVAVAGTVGFVFVKIVPR